MKTKKNFKSRQPRQNRSVFKRINNKKKHRRTRKIKGAGWGDSLRSSFSTAKNYGRATVKGVLSVPTLGLTNTFSGNNGSPEQNWYTYAGMYKHDDNKTYKIFKKKFPSYAMQNDKWKNVDNVTKSFGEIAYTYLENEQKSTVNNPIFTKGQYYYITANNEGNSADMENTDKNVDFTIINQKPEEYKKLISNEKVFYAVNSYDGNITYTTLLPLRKNKETGKLEKAYDFEII